MKQKIQYTIGVFPPICSPRKLPPQCYLRWIKNGVLAHPRYPVPPLAGPPPIKKCACAADRVAVPERRQLATRRLTAAPSANTWHENGRKKKYGTWCQLPTPRACRVPAGGVPRQARASSTGHLFSPSLMLALSLYPRQLAENSRRPRKTHPKMDRAYGKAKKGSLECNSDPSPPYRPLT